MRIFMAATAILLASASGVAADASVADKLAALNKACSLGVLSPRECQQRRAALTKSQPRRAAIQKPAPKTAPQKAAAQKPAPKVSPPQEQSAFPDAPPPGQQDDTSAGSAFSPGGGGATPQAQPDQGGPAPFTPDAGNSAPAENATPANIYRDPQGRFSAPIPNGWNSSNNNGTAQLSSGPAWVVLIASGASQPDQGATDVINQLRGQYQNLNQTNSGRPSVNGHPAVYAVFTGVNGQGQNVDLMVAGISAPGNHVLVFVSSAPAQQVNDFSPAFLQILNGVRFAGEQ